MVRKKLVTDPDIFMKMIVAEEWASVSGDDVFVKRETWKAHMIRQEGMVKRLPYVNSFRWTYPCVKHKRKKICRELMIITLKVAEMRGIYRQFYYWQIHYEQKRYELIIDIGHMSMDMQAI